MLVGNLVSKKYIFAVFLFLFYCSGLASTKLKVVDITFSGNRSYSSKELFKVIKSKKKENFNPRLMRLDEILLSNFYLKKGFLKVFVSSDFSRNADQIFIKYEIKEGRRYYLNKFIFQGNTLLSDGTIKNWISHKVGKPVQIEKIDNGLKKVESYYYNHGKPFVKIKEHREFVGDSLVNVIIEIQENQTVYIEEIQFNGLESVKPGIARRELEIKVGDQYSREKIDVSQRNLYSTALFNFVNFNMLPLDSTQTRMRLVVAVSEKKAKWVGVRFGVAYEQQIIYGGSFDWGLEAGHRNLFGTGRSAAINVIQSLTYDFERKDIFNPKNQISFNYVEPRIFYTRTRGIFQFGFFQARPTNSVDYDLLTAAVRINHEYSKAWTITGELRYQDVITDSVELIKESQGQDEIYSVGMGVVGDGRDNYLNPHYGYLTQFEGKFVYAENIDVDTDARLISRFFKITVQWNRYQPFKWKRSWTLASRVRAGANLGAGDLKSVPTIERFYLGGASTVRGYGEQLLGPVVYDDNGNPLALGGRYLFLVNLELRIPLFWRLYGEMFIDGGNVWSGISEIDPSSIKFTSGAGVAFMTPLGAIRFDYGIKWAPEPPQAPDQFHVGLSWAF